MRVYLLVTLLLLASACHQSNTTSTDPGARKMPFANAAFLTIPHLEEHSLLRRKLLTRALAEELKNINRDELNQEVEITPADQFKFSNDDYKLSKSTLEEYKMNKANSAEVIVSYKDHLEFYFVPTGINKDKAFGQLALLSDSDSEFYWVGATETYLYKNKTYYIVNASKKELKENDVYFNRSEVLIGSDFNEHISSFATNQIIELKIKANYLRRETSLVAVKRGDRPSRKNCDWEAGTCGPCTFQIETSGELISTPLANSELVDLDIIINGRSYPLIELKPLIDSEGNFTVILDLKKIVNTDIASVEFRQNHQYPVTRNVSGINYSGSCSTGNITNVIDVTPSLKINLSANVFGRRLPIF